MAIHDGAVSHNVCYISIPHFDCSYWIQLERGDFSVSDVIGEFSIIDPVFQLETYGSHLVSDDAIRRNYALRRVFSEFERYLPSHLENVPHSFAVLIATCGTRHGNDFVYTCRCYFNSAENPILSPVDFQVSLTIDYVKGVTKQNKKEK